MARRTKQNVPLAALPKSAAWKGLPQVLRDYLAPRMEGAGSRFDSRLLD